MLLHTGWRPLPRGESGGSAAVGATRISSAAAYCIGTRELKAVLDVLKTGAERWAPDAPHAAVDSRSGPLSDTRRTVGVLAAVHEETSYSRQGGGRGCRNHTLRRAQPQRAAEATLLAWSYTVPVLISGRRLYARTAKPVARAQARGTTQQTLTHTFTRLSQAQATGRVIVTRSMLSGPRSQTLLSCHAIT